MLYVLNEGGPVEMKHPQKKAYSREKLAREKALHLNYQQKLK